jgi:3-hydroxybutyryl-CoA dehydratase
MVALPSVARFPGRSGRRIPAVRHPLGALYWQDLHVEDEWESPARTLTETDVVLFAGLTGDYNGLHVDAEAAATGPFGERVAHGLLGLSLVAGLASTAPRVRTLALVSVAEWSFRKPIKPGDTVHVVSRVLTVEPQSRGRRALVTWHRRLVDHRDVTLQEGHIVTLVLGRPAVGRTNAEPASDTSGTV